MGPLAPLSRPTAAESWVFIKVRGNTVSYCENDDPAVVEAWSREVWQRKLQLAEKQQEKKCDCGNSSRLNCRVCMCVWEIECGGVWMVQYLEWAQVWECVWNTVCESTKALPVWAALVPERETSQFAQQPQNKRSNSDIKGNTWISRQCSKCFLLHLIH